MAVDMTHLITGGAGFIGSHLAARLDGLGEHVVTVDNLSGGWADNVTGSLVVADLVTDDLDAIFEETKPDHVWHLAAYAAEGLSHWVREFNYQNNLVASARLINAAVKHGVERFTFTSSMAVYGSQTPPFKEDMMLRPEDPYGIAKHAVEQDLQVASELFGLSYTVFRPHNVYGPNQNLGDPYRNVVGIFMRQALRGEPLTVFGDGSQTRAFSYIGDIVDPMVASITRPGDTFNIGGEQVVTILELAEAVAEMFSAVIVHLPERHETKHAFCDHTKARQKLGFEPATGFADGLRLMADWAETVPVRWSTTPPIEVETLLPEFWNQWSKSAL
jgi:UDP-glucose 4-epimerase